MFASTLYESLLLIISWFYAVNEDQKKRQRLASPEEPEVPTDALTALYSRVKELEAADKIAKTEMFLAKGKFEEINKHIQQLLVRCVPSEQVEERLARSNASLTDLVTMNDRRIGELEGRMVRSINTLTEQLQQLRVHEDATVSNGKLELMIRQARQDLEAQIAAHGQGVTTQLLEFSQDLNLNVHNVKTIRPGSRELLFV